MYFTACPPRNFGCFDGTLCVVGSAVCDGQTQCPDGSDELNCSQYKGCLSGDWKCKNSICIPLSLRCNGLDDCGDNSDEEGCGELWWSFSILHVLFLFVHRMPHNKTSVQTCVPGHCGDLNVRCLNGTCLTLRERCDGVAQCSDGRDEPITCGMAASFFCHAHNSAINCKNVKLDTSLFRFLRKAWKSH